MSNPILKSSLEETLQAVKQQSQSNYKIFRKKIKPASIKTDFYLENYINYKIFTLTVCLPQFIALLFEPINTSMRLPLIALPVSPAIASP